MVVRALAQCHLLLKIGPGANIYLMLCLGVRNISDVAALFRTALTGVAPELCRRKRIYSPLVVIWLMVLQRLLPRGTMEEAVTWLASGKADAVLNSCKRVDEGRISAAAGAYCRARQKLPKIVVIQVADQILERLQADLGQSWPELDGPAFVLDGSSVQLQHCPGILKEYPPAVNQKGQSHWPILKIVVAHEVMTGLARQPQWGPMYGTHAVSEQALAANSIAELPAGSTVIGDRNFGVFSMAAAARDHGHEVLFRLMANRACKIAGAEIVCELDQPVVWKPSAYERSTAKKASTTLPDAISGRLVAIRTGRGKSKQWLFLFTTLRLAPERLAELYKCRWNVETDLRSLKQSVHLQRISTRSVNVLDKELLVACSAYNLVRAVMCLAASKAGLPARRLSFTRVRDVVNANIEEIFDQRAGPQQDAALARILHLASTCRLPQRTHPRSYPREVWGSGYRYPARRAAKSDG